MANPDYTEFNDKEVVKLYDTFNSLKDDGDFWIEIVSGLGVKKIVDMGCGTGLLTCRLAEIGYEVIGIDPAKEMLEIAKSKPHADKIEWIEGSYEKLDGIKADLVIMTSHVAQFFLEDEEWRNLLKTSYKSLNDEGYILFDSKNPILKPWENWTEQKSKQTEVIDNREVSVWYELKNVSSNRVQYEIHYLIDGEETVSKNELIYRPFTEINQYLTEVGFKIVETYGNWDKSKWNQNSPEMIFLVQK